MKKLLLITSFIIVCRNVVVAQKSAVFVTSGVAIHGYDPVAYFNEGKAVKGDSLLSWSWNDANWRLPMKITWPLLKQTRKNLLPSTAVIVHMVCLPGIKHPLTLKHGKLWMVSCILTIIRMFSSFG